MMIGKISIVKWQNNLNNIPWRCSMFLIKKKVIIKNESFHRMSASLNPKITILENRGNSKTIPSTFFANNLLLLLVFSSYLYVQKIYSFYNILSYTPNNRNLLWAVLMAFSLPYKYPAPPHPPIFGYYSYYPAVTFDAISAVADLLSRCCCRA